MWIFYFYENICYRKENKNLNMKFQLIYKKNETSFYNLIFFLVSKRIDQFFLLFDELLYFVFLM